MTVSSETSRWEYVGNGALDTYAYTAKIYIKTDLVVYVAETLLTVDVDYTVTNVGVDGGGNVVFTTPPAELVDIIIYIDLPLTQLTNLVDGDKLPAEALEAVLDRAIKIAQMFQTRLDRILKIPIYSTLGNIEVPIQASTLIGWNAAADAIQLYADMLDSLVITAKGDLVIGSAGGAPERFAIGTNGDILRVASGTVDWEASTGFKLDDWGATEDNVDLNSSTSKHGLCPKFDGDGTHFLSGLGTQIVPPKRSGDIVQIVNYETGAVATGTTIMPFDDTIPEKTEGDQYMSLAITPTNASNKLLIDVIFVGANGGAGVPGFTVGLFQDTTTNALAAVGKSITANLVKTIPLRHYMVAGTVAETTFKIRAGGSEAATTTFNGVSGGRLLGGVMASSITIMEIAV